MLGIVCRDRIRGTTIETLNDELANIPAAESHRRSTRGRTRRERPELEHDARCATRAAQRIGIRARDRPRRECVSRLDTDTIVLNRRALTDPIELVLMPADRRRTPLALHRDPAEERQ